MLRNLCSDRSWFDCSVSPCDERPDVLENPTRPIRVEKELFPGANALFVSVVESILQDTKVSHAWQERHGSGISLFFQCFLDMTITFASIQMVEQNVEETDTSKIITKISYDRVDYERSSVFR